MRPTPIPACAVGEMAMPSPMDDQKWAVEASATEARVLKTLRLAKP